MDIKRVMKTHGVSGKDLAERMGVTTVTVSNHINGNPSVEILERIATAIGCQVGDFFESSNDNTINCPNCGTPIKLTAEKLEGK
ncbi:MAG: helix-turn-helix transcriptional regulator [Rikenellaceae bacterium]|jgi:transcriptional regulator with XRE-family HTH domain|nr:helix-turn-helix transcriptional regulator [Rikenellaceae bacterium]